MLTLVLYTVSLCSANYLYYTALIYDTNELKLIVDKLNDLKKYLNTLQCTIETLTKEDGQFKSNDRVIIKRDPSKFYFFVQNLSEDGQLIDGELSIINEKYFFACTMRVVNGEKQYIMEKYYDKGTDSYDEMAKQTTQEWPILFSSISVESTEMIEIMNSSKYRLIKKSTVGNNVLLEYELTQDIPKYTKNRHGYVLPQNVIVQLDPTLGYSITKYKALINYSNTASTINAEYSYEYDHPYHRPIEIRKFKSNHDHNGKKRQQHQTSKYTYQPLSTDRSKEFYLGYYNINEAPAPESDTSPSNFFLLLFLIAFTLSSVTLFLRYKYHKHLNMTRIQTNQN